MTIARYFPHKKIPSLPHAFSQQDIVKALFSDKDFNAAHRLGAVNSINWARILAQTVYYFFSYFQFRSQLSPGNDDIEIQYVVPTGNFGDVLAGYYAKKMGLPMGKLAVATNSNDILARFWKSGKYEKIDSNTSYGNGSTASVDGASDGKQASASSSVKETLSPAMDILVSSNFERLLWYLAYENATDGIGKDNMRQACETLDGWMAKVKSDGHVEVSLAVLETARKDFVAERISDEQVHLAFLPLAVLAIALNANVGQTLETIQSHFAGQPSYVVDPHTAVGLAAAHIIGSQKSDFFPFPYPIPLTKCVRTARQRPAR